MIFNYIETMVSKSPLDFSYEYGKCNDNSPDKFRCNNIQILTNSFRNTEIRQMTNNPQLDINLFEDLSNEKSYELVYTPSAESSSLEGLTLTKQEKTETTKTAFKNFLSSSLSHGQQIQGIWNTNPQDTNKLGWGLANNLLQLGFSSFGLYSTITTAKENYEANRDSVNEQIQNINEQINDNKAFISNAIEKMNKNKQKYATIQ